MRLRTIGGLWIEGDPTLPVFGPRRLAILALVATAGKKGITRDRIIGILWPESEEEQARHALAQNLYSLRRETRREWITAASELRLDPSISSDISDLEDALAAGDLERVTELSTGSFLDGFYLPGAPEFERWVEAERSRLHDAATRAHERLANRADESGAHSDAVRHWRALTRSDPLSGRYAAALMRALVAAGDRPGALAHARAHEELVRRELESDPDPSIRELVATLRSAPTPSAWRGERTLFAAGYDTPKHEVHTVTPEPALPEAPAEPPPAAPRWRTRGKRWAAIIAVAGLPLFLALAIRPGLERNNSIPPFLAVGSIRGAGAAHATADLVMRDMLATKLGSIQGLHVVANSRLVELLHFAADTSARATSDAARRAGATEVVEGEVIASDAGLAMSLRRVSLKNGVVGRGYVVRAADRFALADSAAAAIARDLNLTLAGGSVADLRTFSPVAYALYNEGVRAFYSGNATVAHRLMTAALENDSTFVMAAFYAWLSRRNELGDPAVMAALQRAKRLAPRTVDRERLLIQNALALTEAPVSVAVAIAETLAVRYPSDPDGFIALGHARTATGDWQGSVAAFERAVAIDSAAGVLGGFPCRICEALQGITGAYMWWDSATAGERTARRLIRLLPDRSTGWDVLIEPLLRLGRRRDAEAAVEQAVKLNPASNAARPALNRDLIRMGRFDDLDRELFVDLTNPVGDREGGRWLLVFSLRNQGRLREAQTLLETGQLPGSSRRLEGVRHDAILLATVSLEQGRWHEAAARFRKIADGYQAGDFPAGFKARNVTWHLTHAGTALAQAGDTVAIRPLADTVERVGKGSIIGRDAKLHHYLRGLIHQHAGRHAEAVLEFQQSLYSLTDGYTRINLAMARSLLALGRYQEAIALLRPAIQGGVDGSNTYVTHTALHEAIADAFTQAGMTDSATVHYRAVEKAWRNADPIFRDRYKRAKSLAQLTN